MYQETTKSIDLLFIVVNTDKGTYMNSRHMNHDGLLVDVHLVKLHKQLVQFILRQGIE